MIDYNFWDFALAGLASWLVGYVICGVLFLVLLWGLTIMFMGETKVLKTRKARVSMRIVIPLIALAGTLFVSLTAIFVASGEGLSNDVTESLAEKGIITNMRVLPHAAAFGTPGEIIHDFEGYVLEGEEKIDKADYVLKLNAAGTKLDVYRTTPEGYSLVK